MGEDDAGEAVRDAAVAVRLDIDAGGAQGVGVSKGLVTEDVDTCELNDCVKVERINRC